MNNYHVLETGYYSDDENDDDDDMDWVNTLHIKDHGESYSRF